MRKTKIFTIVVLSLLLVFSSLSTVALAEGTWERSQVEQHRSAAPEINLYFYPTDASGKVAYGLSADPGSIDAKLGDEKLEALSFGSAKEDPTEYIFLINTSTNGTGYEYLEEIKKTLSSWIDELKDTDSFVLITYADTVNVQLDGSESRSSAKRIIDNISVVVKDADTASAIREGIRISQNEDGSLMSRKVMIMFDNGIFLEEEMARNDLQSSMIEAQLPMYCFCNYPYDNVQESMSEFCMATGGLSYNSNAKSINKDSESMRIYINSCYVLKLLAETNNIPSVKQQLEVVFNGTDPVQFISESILVSYYISDNEAPVVNNFTWNKSSLTVTFSEKVIGADKADNYSVYNADGTEIPIAEVSYDEDNLTSVIRMQEDLITGDYEIKFDGITDISKEANPLVSQDGKASISFSVETENSSVLWIAVSVGIVLIVAIVLIIVAKKKKNQKISEELRLKELAAKKAAKAKIVINLLIELPTGEKRNSKISVGEKLTVGRNPKRCDLAINDMQISGLHMILSYSNGKLIIADAGSTNGTFVNGAAIGKQKQLISGDVINIGKTKITVTY